MKKNFFLGPLTLLVALSIVAGTALPGTARAADFDSPLQLAQQTLTHILAGNIDVSSLANSIATHSLVTKAYVLDPMAWGVSQIVLQTVIKSTLTWINTGFNGSPAFVTNLNQHLQTVGDTSALNFIQQLSSNSAIDSPFKDVLTQAVRTSYLQSTGKNSFFDANKFTLGQASQNPSAFLKGDFSQGGFNAFFLANQPQNNFLGEYQRALDAVNSSAAGAKQTETTQLSWAGGVKSYKGNCAPPKAGSGIATVLSLTSTDPCLYSSIITPGSQILAALTKTQGASIDKLVSSKSFDEIASSFLSNLLVNTLKSGVGEGVKSSEASGAATGAALGTSTTNPGTSGNPASVLNTIIADQITAVKAYQTNWQTIQAQAQKAQACSTDSTIKQTLDSASVALGKAASALTALAKVQADLANVATLAPGTETTAFQNVTDEYAAIMSPTNTSLPSSSEVLSASAQSQSMGADGVPTLFSQMTTLAATCSTAH